MSLQYHFVRTDSGFFMVPRVPQAPLGLAYADIRRMSEADWESRPQLARAMAAHSAREVLADQTERAAVDRARERLNEAEDFTSFLPGDDDAPMWSSEQATDDTESTDAFGDVIEFGKELGSLDFDSLMEGTPVGDRVPQPPQRVGSDFGADQGFDRPNESFESTAFPSASNDQEAISRRAREIYERSRSESSTLDEYIRRGASKAGSVIDELVAPHEQAVQDALDTASQNLQSPTRYRRNSWE